MDVPRQVARVPAIILPHAALRDDSDPTRARHEPGQALSALRGSGG